jgi:Aspartyl protease
MMGRYDVEIDFGTYKMNHFSPDHCPGHVVYWPHAALAVTPMTFHKGHIRLTVKVEGKGLTAEIDTGATNTTMTASAAKRLFDIVPESPGNVPLNSQGMAAAFGHVFSTLDFEGVAVKNPHVVIVPELIGTKDPNNGTRTDTRAKMIDDLEDRPDMLVGMDILKNCISTSPSTKTSSILARHPHRLSHPRPRRPPRPRQRRNHSPNHLAAVFRHV